MPRRIGAVTEELPLPEAQPTPFGRGQAEVELGALEAPAGRPRGDLAAFSAISPMQTAEGKTTVGVGSGLTPQRLGARAMLCPREPSLGPIFGDGLTMPRRPREPAARRARVTEGGRVVGLMRSAGAGEG